MGRYAEFSTMFTYKFGFGTQSSNDITLFGGECMGLRDDEGRGWWHWTRTDQSKIMEKLQSLNCTLPDFTKYENNCNGTAELYSLFPTDNLTILLGVLIYHQLLYTENLTSEFEF